MVQAPGQSVGVVTLTGNGQWIMSDNPMNRVYGASNAFTLINDGNTIKGAGQITDVLGNFNFTNTLGSLVANGTNALQMTLGGGFSTNNAVMSATGAGGLVLVNGLYVNNGTMLAGAGSSITFQSGAINTNLTEGVLVGGTWEAIASGTLGATLSMTGGPINVDGGVLIVSGAGSVIQAGSGTTATPYTQIEQTMSSIASGGQLQILNNRNYTTALVMDSFGTIQLGGGTLQAAVSTIEVPGLLTGFGRVNSGFINQGTILAKGGTLTLTHVVGASGVNGGTLESNSGAVLALMANGYSAGTVINNGSLFVSAVTVLDVLSGLSGTGALTDNGAIIMSAGANFIDSGAVAVVGKLQLAGGTLTAGTLSVASAGTLVGFGTVTNAIANAGHVEANGGTLTLSNNVTGAGGLQVDPGRAGTLGGPNNTEAAVVNNGTVTLNTGKSLTVSGNASGNGAYVVNSTSTLTLNGTGSTSGAITDNGVLTIGANAALTASGNVSGTGLVGVISGAVLTLNGASNIATLTDNGTVSIGTNDNLTVTGVATVNGTIHPHGGTLTTGLLSMGSNGALIGFGTVSNVVPSAKLVEANGGTLTINGAVTSAGTVQSDAGAVLVLTGTGNSATTVTDNGAINIGGKTLTASGTVTVGGTGAIKMAAGAFSAGSLSIASGGVLSGSGSVTGAPVNAGRIEASGGTLAVSGAVTGAGTLQADSGAALNLNGTGNSQASMLDNGTVNIGGSDSLDVTGSVGSSSTGLFVLTNASLLEVAADTGGSSQISFLGASGDKLVVDAVGSFGSNVGTTSCTGPLLENFAAVDTVDLKNLLFSGATIDSYTSGTGLLQLHSGATKATLLFQNSSLGSGSFHIAADSGTGTVVTHS